jgi:hypothetical protein
MISANEARTIVRESEADIQKALDAIDPLIRKAAAAGISFLEIPSSITGDIKYMYPGSLDTRQQKIFENLRGHGYMVDTVTYEERGGFGIDMEDHVEKYHLLRIRW